MTSVFKIFFIYYFYFLQSIFNCQRKEITIELYIAEGIKVLKYQWLKKKIDL